MSWSVIMAFPGHTHFFCLCPVVRMNQNQGFLRNYPIIVGAQTKACKVYRPSDMVTSLGTFLPFQYILTA